ncbi:MAG: LLM class flavin-dependent oxidoreductase [Acidimicrobiia bacterium]|nr:LLM class flavin-dependent oxidoreductase [Acidimicrobiia bacterium]MDH4363756.1 LLM class flavin-dependent oxidoreductase [Acidimicrobiia bacterium]
MRFGVLYNIDYHESVHGSASQYYGAILDQIVALEQLGYDSVWFGEHHYAKYSFGSPVAMVVAAAGRTSRIRLGTGVSLLPLHHPLRLAEEYAMADVLSGGRLEYGIGRGFLKSAYDLFGIDTEESNRRYREGAEVLLTAWRSAGRKFDTEGEFFAMRGAELFPPPIQQPHPPVYASGAATLDNYLWAARHGLNLATAFFLPRQDFVRDAIAQYRATLADHGFDPATREVLGVIQMYCAKTNEEAAHRGWEFTQNYLRFFSGLDSANPHQADAYGAYRHRGSGRSMGDMSYERFDQSNLSLIGDPERVIAKLHWIQDYYQPDGLLLEVAQGGVPPDMVTPICERFARHVMPLFR